MIERSKKYKNEKETANAIKYKTNKNIKIVFK